MDQINSNPYFDSARLYQAKAAPQTQSSQAQPGVRSELVSRAPQTEKAADFSNMFDDDALLKLQGNLEAIAQMAEKSLKQIDGE